MTRAERDAALALAAERYGALLRLQRQYLVLNNETAAAELEPNLNEVCEDMVRLAGIQITPDLLSKRE